MPIGTIIPPTPASSGSVTRRRSRSSPMSNSRRASSPTTMKKNVISPELTQPRRSCAMPRPPRRTESCVPHSVAYDEESMFTQASAMTVAPSSTAALPVSVRGDSLSGVSRLRAQAVRPEKVEADPDSAIHGFSLADRCGDLPAEMSFQVAQNIQVMAGPEHEERSTKLGLLAAHDRVTHALQELPAAARIRGLRPGHRCPVDDGITECDIPGAQSLDLPVDAHAARHSPGPGRAPVADPGPVHGRGPVRLRQPFQRRRPIPRRHPFQGRHRPSGAQYPSCARDQPGRAFRVYSLRGPFGQVLAERVV